MSKPYVPQLLLLAPAGGEDTNVLSLVAQFLEMGVPFELDEKGHLPTALPRDLSDYVACLFPETAAQQYDAQLDQFYSNGGYLGYFKYYPVVKGPGLGGIHHYFESYGRDCYFFGMANVMLEGGLRENDPDFRRFLRSRSNASILADYREMAVAKLTRHQGPWRSWGDPTYTFFLANLVLGQQLGDAQWLTQVDRCIDCLADAGPEALARPQDFQEVKMKGIVETTWPLVSSLLMSRGHARPNARLVEVGSKLAQFYFDNGGKTDGVFREPWMRLWWSESLAPLPAMTWLAKSTGQKKFNAMALKLLQHCMRLNQDETGLWHHWSSDDGSRKGSRWSRGQMWPVLFMTESLAALERDSELHAMMLRSIRRTFDGLRRVQHADSGLWHLVVDDPHTRLESSATAGLLYCHDRLRDAKLIGNEYQEMFDRAFVGLKGLYYRGGLACTCRGTGTGNADYYRTRPIGWYNMSLFPAAFANRK